MTRRVFSAGIAVGVLALVVVSQGSPRSVREGGTFRVATPAQFFVAIDPAHTSTLPESIVLSAACAGLMTTPDKPLPGGLRVVPEIAADYPRVGNGGKTYTFRVRRGFRFSNGAPVTARDFAHTLNRLISPEMKSNLAPDFAGIVGAQAVSEGRAKTAPASPASATGPTSIRPSTTGSWTSPPGCPRVPRAIALTASSTSS